MRKTHTAAFAAAALAAALAMTLSSCASLDKPFLKVQIHPISDCPDEDAAILTYPGNTFVTINLYSIDNVVRRAPYDLALPASFTQYKTAGFGLRLESGEHSIEIEDFRRKDIVRIGADLAPGKYALNANKEGYAIQKEGEKEEIEIAVEPVPAYDVASPGAAVLRLPKLAEDKPAVFRINGMRPATLDKNIAGCHYTFSSDESEIEIPLREGENVIEYMTYQDSMTIYNSWMIFTHSLGFTAEPGKVYTIARPAPGANNQILTIN